MVENRPWTTFAAHAVLVLGVLVVAFPVYMTFVASTHDQAAMLSGPVPLLPGRHLVENYRTAHRIHLLQQHGDVSTEQQREAFVHYRALFEKLLETTTDKDTSQEASA